MRRVTALLASASAVGGLIELAMLRHWSGIQIAPWVILGVIAVVGVVTALGGPRRLAQVAGGFGLFGALAGMWHHIEANHALGPHVPPYAESWATMSAAEQWWVAAAGGLGPAPALAPGLLGLAGALLLVAVIDR